MELDYRNKVVLAPMVRVGTLPMRLMALGYGADMVYGPEIIDLSLMRTKRVVNETFGTIDFIRETDNTLQYCTNDNDVCNIAQIGTSDPVTALKAAEIVFALIFILDFVGIDINMGCPKHFSIQGGMGAALLSKPEKIKDILTTLLRLLDTLQETVELMKIIEKTGVRALAVHARRIPERPRDPPHWDILKEAVKVSNFSIPIIGNGNVFKHEDINKFKEETGVDSVMIARGAMENVSIFSPNLVSQEKIAKKYIKKSIKVGNMFPNTKYVLTSMGEKNFENPELLTQSSNLWSLNEFYEEHANKEYYENNQKSRKKKGRTKNDTNVSNKKQKI